MFIAMLGALASCKSAPGRVPADTTLLPYKAPEDLTAPADEEPEETPTEEAAQPKAKP